MRIDWWAGGTLVVLTMFGAAMAAESQPYRVSPLPANVEFHPRDLEARITRIDERSPTFRSQCDRISAAGNLRITVVIDTAIPSHCRAFSIIQRQGGTDSRRGAFAAEHRSFGVAGARIRAHP